ncbi:MAG: discoidin domain-containing protein [Bacilli bacterium]
MCDGNINTRWSSGTPMKKGNWIAVDFGYPKSVSQIVFKLGSSKNDFPDKVEVLA